MKQESSNFDRLLSKAEWAKVDHKDMTPSLTWCGTHELTGDKTRYQKLGPLRRSQGVWSPWRSLSNCHGGLNEHLFSTKHRRPSVLVLSGCYNKIPQTRTVINNRN